MTSSNLSIGRAALTAAIWLTLVAIIAPHGRGLLASVVLAIGAWFVQLVVSQHVGPWTRFAGTVTFQASQIWFGSAAALIAAILLGRVIPTPIGLEVVAAALVSAIVHAVARHLGDAAKSYDNLTRAVVVGTGEEAAEWITLIDDHPETGVDMVGCIGDFDLARRVGIEDRWLGEAVDVISIMQEHEIEMPIVAVTSFRRPALQVIVDKLQAQNIDIGISWGVGRLSTRRFESTLMSNETLPIIRAQREQALARGVKRLFDIIISVVMLVLTAPLMLVVAILVRLDSKGPAFYRQIRVGKNAEPFPIIKLRSMVVDADQVVDALEDGNQREGPLFKMSRDPRVTRMGRIIRATSLDEIPQLVNVVRGQMSLVGPRPSLFEEFEAFDDELVKRIAVRPGLTGLWQVEARANKSFDAYRRLDLHYLENWSLVLDIRIMIATAQVLVLGALLSPIAKRLERRASRSTRGVYPSAVRTSQGSLRFGSDSLEELSDMTELTEMTEMTELTDLAPAKNQS